MFLYWTNRVHRSSYVFGLEVVINNSTIDCTVSELRTPGFINPTNSCLYCVSFIWWESFYSRRHSQNQTYEYSKKGTVLGFSLPWRPQCFSQACIRKIYTLFLKKSIVYWCGLNWFSFFCRFWTELALLWIFLVRTYGWCIFSRFSVSFAVQKKVECCTVIETISLFVFTNFQRTQNLEYSS